MTVYDSLAKVICNKPYNELLSRGAVEYANTCIDGVDRPYIVYIPKNYNPSQKTPLFVYLHGGVGRPKIIENRKEYILKLPFIEQMENENMLILFPFADCTSMWWDSVGTKNILSQIVKVKNIFNVDDNRVLLAGFSDGASAAYFLAMCHPTNFAAFIPLIGHPGVGSEDGYVQTYFQNLFGKNIYAINTDIDEIYPDKNMRPMVKLAQSAGANNFSYKSYQGHGHKLSYMKTELPFFMSFIKQHVRDCFPPKIIIETVNKAEGRCLWFQINKANNQQHENWYKDYNMELTDDRVYLGVAIDYDFKGKGVKLSKVYTDDSPGYDIGLLAGDILLQIENTIIQDPNNLSNYFRTKKRGDNTNIKLMRNNVEITLKGKFPEVKKFPLFKRGKPSAYAEATFSGNEFNISASGLAEFSEYIHPAMVQLDQPVKIFVNGKCVFDKIITIDKEFMMQNFAETGDRELLYVNRIEIKL